MDAFVCYRHVEVCVSHVANSQNFDNTHKIERSKERVCVLDLAGCPLDFETFKLVLPQCLSC